MSAPAKTVASLSGRTSCCSANATPGRAFPAAQPQIEFTMIIKVPGVGVIELSRRDIVKELFKLQQVGDIFHLRSDQCGWLCGSVVLSDWLRLRRIDAEVLRVREDKNGRDALIPKDTMQAVGLRPRQRFVIAAKVNRRTAIDAEDALDAQDLVIKGS